MAENIHIKDLNRHRWLMAEREDESDIEVKIPSIRLRPLHYL
jgi:hypothetical protein